MAHIGISPAHRIGTIAIQTAGKASPDSLPHISLFNATLTMDDIESLVRVCQFVCHSILSSLPSLFPYSPHRHHHRRRLRRLRLVVVVVVASSSPSPSPSPSPCRRLRHRLVVVVASSSSSPSSWRAIRVAAGWCSPFLAWRTETGILFFFIFSANFSSSS